MAMRLFNNAFSPFARKVRLVLDYKGIDYEIIDGLDKSNAEALEQVNGRAEVPTLVDGEVTVVNSADIAAYLDRHDLPRHPLVAQGYPSIGCEPCTSRVADGEDPRAGRWRGSDKTECGIHYVEGQFIGGGGI